MRYFVSAMLLMVGVIHLLPLSGVLGAERLADLYGLPFNERNLVVLMRHRAILFGLLGAFCVYAAFKRELQPVAFVAAFVSVISFIGLAWPSIGLNAQVGRVFTVDLVALACLVLGLVAYVYVQRP